MNPWAKYFFERFYPYLSLTVIIGMALTGVVIDRNLFRPISFVVACLTIFYIAFLLRLNNDIKDYDSDRIAFPNRALPRGLISKRDAENALRFLVYGLIIGAVLLFITYWGNTRVALLLTAAYLWLLLKDFYAKKCQECGTQTGKRRKDKEDKLPGTEGGTRTLMMLPPPDFESGASTNSATSASCSGPASIAN